MLMMASVDLFVRSDSEAGAVAVLSASAVDIMVARIDLSG